MALVNHLKNNEAQRKVLAVASGRHVAEGHLLWSKTLGTSPTHNIVVRQALGKGDWDSIEGIWYKGLNVPSADYVFQNGSQTTPDTTFFPTDTDPHTGTVLLDVKAGTGVGDADTKTTTPDKARAIVKTEKFPDFNASGDQINPVGGAVVVTHAALLSGTPLDKTYFTYTAKPARVVVGWMFKYGKISVDRINWAKWVAWRDYCATTEVVDYTTISGFEGIGLSAEYYSGTLFNTLLWKRIDPVLNFANTTGAPAVGLPVDSFSVKWKGKIKAKYSETYTFKAVHDNGVKVWVNGTLIINQWTDDGQYDIPTLGNTHTGTIALTAGSFYTIEVWWNEGIANAEFSLKWSSASQTEEVIPQAYLYPEATNNARYEAHVAFSTPTTLDAMIAAVLMVSNSIKQDVDGKIEFYCVEQLASSFAFNEADNPKTILDIQINETESMTSLKFYRSDVRETEVQNVFEATFRDLDSQYLEEPLTPIRESVQELIDSAGREIYGDVIDLYNMTRWQARKVLKYIVERIAGKDLFVEFNGSALAYQVIAGDVVTLTHSLGGEHIEDKEFMVIEAHDKSPEDTADERYFKLQEW
jgi:hypothetical protein